MEMSRNKPGMMCVNSAFARMPLSKSPKKQRGVSMVTIMVVILVAGIVATLAAKLVPVYRDNYAIKSLMDTIKNDVRSAKMDNAELEEVIEKHMTVNAIYGEAAKSLEFFRENGEITLVSEYEVRDNLFKNLDIVLSFSNEVSFREM